MLGSRGKLLAACAALFAVIGALAPAARADVAPARPPGRSVPIVLGEGVVESPPGAAVRDAFAARSAAVVTQTSDFIVTYTNSIGSPAFPTAARAAFDAAISFWETTIVSSVPIRIKANWGGASGGTLGTAGPEGFQQPPGGLPDTWYPNALANAMAGVDMATDEVDIDAKFNPGSNWSFSTTGQPGSQIDFMSVVHHELLHGLGHLGFLAYGTGNCGAPTNACFQEGFIGVYDRMAETAGGVPLTSLPPAALGAAVTTPQGVVFDGPATNLGGGPAVLHTPNPYSGSSFAHIDNKYDGTGDGVMTPSVAAGEVSRPSHLVLGMLKDMGYTISPPTDYVPLKPARILDTRDLSSPIGSNASINVPVVGVGGVPATGVGAVVLNVTATQPSVGGFFTVWPTGETMPVASNLNFVANQTVPNVVIAKVGAGGSVSVYNAAGTTHAILDVQGWIPTDEPYVPMTPLRIVDTRPGSPVGPGGTLPVQVTGMPSGPPTGTPTVVLNVTATEPTANGGFFTVWPGGETRPLASNLNFNAGQSVPNVVVAKVGPGGIVNIFNSGGTTDVIVDVQGYFSSSDADLHSLTPFRLLDTREPSPVPAPPGSVTHLQVLNRGGVPGSGVSAVVLNVTVTGPTGLGSYLTVWPAGATQPTASNLNFAPGQTIANLVVAKVGTGGVVEIFNFSGNTHIIVDVAGWYSIV